MQSITSLNINILLFKNSTGSLDYQRELIVCKINPINKCFANFLVLGKLCNLTIVNFLPTSVNKKAEPVCRHKG